MNEALVIKYGDHTADFNTLPQASLVAMLRRGFGHFMGSEQASKVTEYFKPDNADETTLADTPENRAKMKADCQAKAMQALLEGKVGVSTRGPAVDPITKIIRRLATAEAKEKISAAKLAWPKKAEDVIEFPDGRKLTATQLVDKLIAKKGTEYKRDAEKIAAEQARKAKKLAETAAAEGFEGLFDDEPEAASA